MLEMQKITMEQITQFGATSAHWRPLDPGDKPINSGNFAQTSVPAAAQQSQKAEAPEKDGTRLGDSSHGDVIRRG